jgi:hypothetical protein
MVGWLESWKAKKNIPSAAAGSTNPIRRNEMSARIDMSTASTKGHASRGATPASPRTAGRKSLRRKPSRSHAATASTKLPTAYGTASASVPPPCAAMTQVRPGRRKWLTVSTLASGPNWCSTASLMRPTSAKGAIAHRAARTSSTAGSPGTL